MNGISKQAANIRLLICDVDGVLTDGRLYYTESGIEFKAFHVQDGMGIKLLLCGGIEVAIITTSNSEVIANRAKWLGIKHVYLGQVNKESAYQHLLSKLNLDAPHVSYIGDDLPDLPIIEKVGLGVAVANAHKQVLQKADWITERVGGDGAVRELCDLILDSQGILTTAIEKYNSLDGSGDGRNQ